MYDFANTIFSFAVVSYAIGLWLDRRRRASARARATGVFSIAVVVSVGINAIVSPILGALQRPRRPAAAVPARVHGAVRRPDGADRVRGPARRRDAVRARELRVPAALIYYDASLKLVSTPETRGRMSGMGVGIGYCGTVFSGCSCSCSTSRSKVGSCSPPCCSRCWRSRSSWSFASRRRLRDGRIRVGPRRLMEAAVDDDRPRARASRACRGSSWAGSSTRTPSTPSSS